MFIYDTDLTDIKNISAEELRNEYSKLKKIKWSDDPEKVLYALLYRIDELWFKGKKCSIETYSKPLLEICRSLGEAEKNNGEIIPSPVDTFRCLRLLKPYNVKVLILAQDPYPDVNKVDGLSFSVKEGYDKRVASIDNILKFLRENKFINTSDTIKTRSLISWKSRGVLLLNYTPTVLNNPNASNVFHVLWKKIGIVETILNNVSKNALKILMGNYAKEKASMFIKSTVRELYHPSRMYNFDTPETQAAMYDFLKEIIILKPLGKRELYTYKSEYFKNVTIVGNIIASVKFSNESEIEKAKNKAIELFNNFNAKCLI